MKKQKAKLFLNNYFNNNKTAENVIANADIDALGPLSLKAVIASESNTLILTSSLNSTEAVYASINEWKNILDFNISISVLHEIGNNKEFIPENEAKRSRTFYEAGSSEKRCFIASVNACFSMSTSLKKFIDNYMELKVGESYEMDKLAAKLVDLDYDNEYQVGDYCEFALRGGIIDIYSPLEDYPVRIEFWGNEIDNMRLFSPQSQKSIKIVNNYKIVPRSSASEGNNRYTFLDYFNVPPHVIIIYPDECKNFIDENKSEIYNEKLLELELIDCKLTKIYKNIENSKIVDKAVNSDISSIPIDITGDFNSETEGIGHDLYNQIIRNQIHYWLDNDYDISIFINTEITENRLKEWACENEFKISDFTFLIGQLTKGVIFGEHKKVLLSYKEVFFAPHKRSPYKSLLPVRQKEAITRSAYADIEVGSQVVHINHGIGIYHGIKEIKVSGSYREVMEIEFDEEVRLYVPIWQASLITRYIGTKKNIPKLSKIGEMRWARLKNAAQRAAKTLAAEMLRIQAMRYSCDGYKFPEDDEEQFNFEMAFPFVETVDQIKASHDIKSDLMMSKPMDRLVCGDVGYGKTEVAMRGVFKVVMTGKQVAILTPTTILAQQHYYTFLERFAEYPVIIEMISRFRTKAEQKKIIEDLKEGKIDIVIGTHRLTQNDVDFKSLGLVVIDEEQRFGVAHKEKFKKMRSTVDVLTMTATPIPRTLYLAMSGIRDLSTIMTAPNNRLPVQTMLCLFDFNIIKKAILNEVKRSGQVFYLYNRVKTIDRRCKELQELIPDVKFAVAHGQMNENELEEIMSQFIDGKIDVLICTTIIESGVDIPNANTIIIERADRFGLAELYQLRGRVGRWSRQAYAYLLIPESNIMSSTARERLGAIRKYTQLGAGFKLALRDLEIRGSGNILGTQQSGHINAVGFGLYCQLLKSSISLLKGKKDICTSEVDLFFDFIDFGQSSNKNKLSAHLSSKYITSERLRLEFYRKFSFVVSYQEIEDLTEEIKDRFGKLPSEAKLYIEIMKLRLTVSLGGYSSLSVRDGHIFIENDKGKEFLLNGKIPEIKSNTAEQKLIELSDIINRYICEK
ncbi:MAG: transcription-repair coupling factor [bacterium]|nr:transcription-repair coupling factor [bacterium]